MPGDYDDDADADADADADDDDDADSVCSYLCTALLRMPSLSRLILGCSAASDWMNCFCFSASHWRRMRPASDGLSLSS